MVVTKIEKQRKNSKRSSLYIDGEFACGLFDDALVKFGLKPGDEISEKILDELVNYDEYLYAKKSAFDLLSYRLRSIREIKDKLMVRKISPKTIDRTIEHLTELGLLNDEEFSRQLVLNYISSRPKGKKVIRQKLFQKGISKPIADKIIEEIFENIDEKQVALGVFEKYSKKLKMDKINIKKRKIFNYLAGKGFDFDIINELINENLN